MARNLPRFNYGSGYMVGRLPYTEATDYSLYLSNLQDPKTPVFEVVERIANKNAWVVRDTANGNICLQSYRTIVSMKVGDSTVDFGIFSNTTTRHQGDFRAWCRAN